MKDQSHNAINVTDMKKSNTVKEKGIRDSLSNYYVKEFNEACLTVLLSKSAVTFSLLNWMSKEDYMFHEISQ